MQCLLFPGQGVQRKGMGADLFAHFPETTALADGILGYSIEELCTRDPHRRLRDTQFAQPAVFVVNALLGMQRANEQPDAYRFFAGHSLGEYNALVAAGVLDFGTALRLVRRRGELMAGVTGGAMSAVQGVPAAFVERVLRETGLSSVHVANLNADTQTAIAGDRVEVAVAAKAIGALPGARVVPLNVSGPFHSPLMAPVEPALRELLRACVFADGHGTVVSSVTGAVFRPDEGAELLARQVSTPVQWVRAVTTLRAAGVTRFDEAHGSTLTALVSRIH
ncbi:acyltransferase domain-containing protein [Micromonospora sp. WMMD1128]|uniref:ACP S-malonyltransferase n=1 Tax=Micromonospora sp. WMMD1128 TaxID=3015150 RepID=UPI00248C2DC9|nr:acyltransferase domain-containing protein [Micromonospora sp. WMMD1128]WBB75642.1 acyltransferase domain-containing protein [Micromonospora sp. WMMD1128]